MAKISVFGIGYVGVVSAACLARDGHDVTAVDLDPDKVGALNEGRSPIVEAGLDDIVRAAVTSGRLRATEDAADAVRRTQISLVCVGTPSEPDGSVGLAHVAAACRVIGAALPSCDGFHSVVIRSTIVPGSTEGTCIPALERASGLRAGDDFGVGYFPEFLREGVAIRDYDDPGLIVFGTLDARTGARLEELNAALPCAAQHTDIRTAEMVKYTSNAWRAFKIGFANEIGTIAKASGIDGQAVMNILCSDAKVAMSPAFLKPGFAFGGSCLPKDLRALRQHARSCGAEPGLIDAVLSANDQTIARAEDMVLRSGAGRVGFVGIAFKPGTDDLRESPLVALASRLIDRGIDVDVFDPFVQAAFNAGNPGAGRGNDGLPDLDRRLVPDLDGLIDRAEALVIGNRYAGTAERLRAAAETHPVVDLARLDPGRVSGGTYEGICW